MRSAEEMLDAVLSFARADDRILAVGMEGSRVNVNIPPDAFQDYDITYFVRSIGAFSRATTAGWRASAGRFGSEARGHGAISRRGTGVQLSMLFDDYVKLDLTLLEPKGPAGVSRAGPSAHDPAGQCGLVGPLPPRRTPITGCKSRPRGRA